MLLINYGYTIIIENMYIIKGIFIIRMSIIIN